MPYPAHTYIQQLRALQADLGILMSAWPSGASFDAAKVEAKTAAPLITSEIANLQNAAMKLNPSNLVALRGHLEKLNGLMSAENRAQFSQYIAMLDSLINEGVS